MKRFFKKCLIVLLVVTAIIGLCSCGKKEERTYYKSVSEMEHATIAAWTGSDYEDCVKKALPEATVLNLDWLADMFKAMEDGSIDAVSYQLALYPSLKKEFPQVTYLSDFEGSVKIAPVFGSGEENNALKELFNEFLKECREDGRLEKLQQEWLFGTEHAYEGLNEWDGSNGTLKVGCGSSTPPFIYIYNNCLSGFEYALIAEFAKENGYHVNYEENQFTSLIPAAQRDMYNIVISGFSYTEERAESANFADIVYEDKIVLYVMEDPANLLEFNSVEELDGKVAGSLVGSVDADIIPEAFPNSEVLPFNDMGGCVEAVLKNKIDFFLTNRSMAKILRSENENIGIIEESLVDQNIGLILNKDTERGETLRLQLNEFIANNKDLINEIIYAWENDYNNQGNAVYNFTGENGVIKAAGSGTIIPHSVVKNGVNTGIEVDILSNFCLQYGYTLDVSELYEVSAIIPAVTSGRADIGFSGFCITEERKKSVNFTDSYYTDGLVPIVRSGLSETSFFDSLKESFNKTFVREERWKLVLNGVLSTLRISVFSVLLGTLFGFAIYLLCRKERGIYTKVLNLIFDFFARLLDGIPMVVILMIMYYLIFSGSSMSGEVISIIGFSVCFGLGVFEQLKVSVKAIDKGQTEGALSLGFTDFRAFFNIVLPQALSLFLPGYKTSIVSLIKGSAVVGYIAVQDLTKVSDIIRSRTYEAFFPLISIAIIYLLLGMLLSFLVNKIEVNFDPECRTKEKILKKFEK